jgi:hypothetical protein
MSRFHANEVLSVRAAAQALGVTLEEFQDLRKRKIAPDPDVNVPGEPIGWKPSTISRLKRYLATHNKTACVK